MSNEVDPDLPADLLDEEEDGTTQPTLIDPRNVLANAVLDTVLPARVKRVLAGRKTTLALVIAVPSAAWSERITSALTARYPHTATRNFATAPRKAGGAVEQDLSLLSVLAKGRSIIAVSPDPETMIPAAIRMAADEIVTIGDPDVATLRRAIQVASGKRTVRNLRPADYSGLDFPMIASALRNGDGPAAIIARLRAIKARQSQPAAGLGKTVPSLDQLPLTASIRKWSDQLLSDLKTVEAGQMSPDQLVFGVLEGPPGTGKTLIAESLAVTAGWTFIATGVGAWFTSGDGALGGVARNVKGFVDQLLATDRAIGFLDELDAVPDRATMDNRGRDWWTPIVALILVEIDRVRKSGRKVLLLGASNYYSRLDSALIRPGRLQQRIPVLPPSTESEVVELLRYYLPDEFDPSGLAKLARLGLGATPAAIEGWVKEARSAARAEGRGLQLLDLLDQMAPKDDRSAEDVRTIAIHEIGHAVVAVRLGIEVEHVSIVAEGVSGGRTITRVPTVVPTLGRLTDMVTLALGGRAADIALGIGPHAGAEADLSNATDLLVAAYTRQGLHGGLMVRPVDSLGLLRAGPAGDVIEAELQRLLKCAIAIIRSATVDAPATTSCRLCGRGVRARTTSLPASTRSAISRSARARTTSRSASKIANHKRIFVEEIIFFPRSAASIPDHRETRPFLTDLTGMNGLPALRHSERAFLGRQEASRHRHRTEPYRYSRYGAMSEECCVMSETIATPERVQEEALKLLAVDPRSMTISAVIAAVGGGSRATVAPILKGIRSEHDAFRAASTAVPAELRARADALVTSLFGEARAEASRLFEDRSSRLDGLMHALEADVAESGVLLSDATEQIALLQSELDDANKKNADLEARSAALVGANAQLEASARTLKQELERAEETIAAQNRRLEANQTMAERLGRIEKTLKINASATA